MNYFVYGEEEIEYLKKRDKKLGAAIDQIGMIEREIILDPFQAIITSVVGQQISNKAADTVNARLLNLVGAIAPDNIGKANIEDIQKCGMSYRKAQYIKGIADAALNKTIDFNNLHKLSDEEIIKSLTSLYGVGVWTAEMLLIFSLARMDVLSFKDLAIVRGMMRLYGLEKVTKAQFEKYRKRYSPYGSVASLYLWELSI
jgi:3-methyladenine DNA glycosylase/8-oxoguanine DNA glycosylase